MFFSQDARERSVVRVVVHHLYGRLPKRRPLFRRVFAELLWNVTTLADHVTGVNDLLTVYSSIVCGFALPIRPEHKRFLVRCLLPLHKLARLSEFSTTLTQCLLLFLSRDPSLAPKVRLGGSGSLVGY